MSATAIQGHITLEPSKYERAHRNPYGAAGSTTPEGVCTQHNSISYIYIYIYILHHTPEGIEVDSTRLDDFIKETPREVTLPAKRIMVNKGEVEANQQIGRSFSNGTT